jgi:hypothetical protein
MFSFFKKSEASIPYTDKVWKKREYALKGMLVMAMMRLQQGKPCLLVYFFESEGEQLSSFMQEHKLDFVRLDDSANRTVSASLYLANAGILSKSDVGGFLKQNANQFSGEAFFSGHYPIQAVEKTALQSLSTAGFKKFTFCLSFDDPLVTIFTMRNLLPLVEKLGYQEEEAIEHPIVTKALQRVREKVEEEVKLEVKAISPEEWFAFNWKK